MYTKAQLIDQVLLRVTGGQLAQDVNVHRNDIEQMVPSAINWAIKKEILNRLGLEMDKWDKVDFRRYKPSEEFLKTYSLIIQKDDARGLNYAALPVPLAIMPANHGIGDVFCKGKQLIKVSNQFMLQSISFKTQMFWWYENDGTQKIFFDNLSVPYPTIYIRMIPDYSQEDDDVTIPFPAGIDLEVIDYLYEKFMQQRMNPGSEKNDKIDVES